MKRLFLIIILFLQVFFLSSQEVSKAMAIKVAENFMASQGNKVSVAKSGLVPQALSLAYDGGFSYYSSAPAAYYVVKFNPGFVIVSGREEAKPIIGYSMEGNFDETYLPESFEYLMMAFSNGLDSIKRTPAAAKIKASANSDIWNTYKTDEITTTATTQAFPAPTVAPLLNNRWTQFHPYNSQIQKKGSCVNEHELNNPNCLVGCVALATAQIMHYWGYPIGAYDWCNMPAELTSSSTSTQINTIAGFLSKLGKEIGMSYCITNKCQSSGFFPRAISRLNTYGYAASDDYSSSPSLAKSELDQGRPLLGQGGGHVYVIDGYDNSGRLHFNFAWYSAPDGYYDFGEDSYYSSGANFYYGIQPNSLFDCYSTIEMGTKLDSIARVSPANIINYLVNPPVVGNIKTAHASAYSSSQYRTIPLGKNADYKVYNSVTLNPGFTVEIGGTLNCSIISCPARCSKPNR